MNKTIAPEVAQQHRKAEELEKSDLRARILEGVTMVDQIQACELLGASLANPSAAMEQIEEEGELLKFEIDGQVQYPVFQFDAERQEVFPVIAKLMEKKPEFWSNFMMLHWLMRPHVSFEKVPSAHLRSDGEAVLDALRREVEDKILG